MPFDAFSQFFLLLFVILNPLLWSESGENGRNSKDCNKGDKDVINKQQDLGGESVEMENLDAFQF